MYIDETIQIDDYRMYTVTNFITLLGIPAHTLFIPLFFYLGYDLLAYFNFLSVTLWVYARYSNSRGHLTRAITVLIIEVMMHAFLATISLGIESGFHYYFFGLIPYAMFHQELSRKGFVALALSIGFSYVISVFYAGSFFHPIDPMIMKGIYYGNIFIVMFGITLISIFFREASLELEESLKERVNEREVLIREVHHRVKNNMQIIISLLHLQGDKYDNEISEQIIQATESRINSMLLVHEKLFQNESVSAVDVSVYIEALVDDLRYNLVSDQSIEMVVECEAILFNIDRLVPLGLIINEAVTNAVKYADFKEQGRVEVSLKQEVDKVVLRICDNGASKPESYEREGSIGSDLISGLATSKLKGQSSLYYDEGTIVEVLF